MGKNSFCVPSKNKCFKDNVKPAHWVGHSQLRSLNADGFFKIKPVVDEKNASVTGNKMKQSVSRGGVIQFYSKNNNKV